MKTPHEAQLTLRQRTSLRAPFLYAGNVASLNWQLERYEGRARQLECGPPHRRATAFCACVLHAFGRRCCKGVNAHAHHGAREFSAETYPAKMDAL